MISLERLGKNIRALRKAYGFTQEDLGNALGVERNTISQYETGRNMPDREILESIADFFLVPVEELTSGDYSDMPSISVDAKVLWEKIDVVFPIISSDETLKNEHFKKANMLHRAVFEDMKKQSLDTIESLGECQEEYQAAADENDATDEAIAANLWGLVLFMELMIKAGSMPMKVKSANLSQAMIRDKTIAEMFKKPDPSFIAETEELINEMNNPDVAEGIRQCKMIVKSSASWNELAYYYVALEHVWNIKDNGLSARLNAKIGAEMLASLVEMENPYAIRFYEVQRSGLGLNR